MSDCIEWLWARNAKGYGMLGYGGKIEKAHRVAYSLANNTPIGDMKGLVVMHSCDNPGCVNPDHLSLGTHADNVKDRCKKDRTARGVRHHNSKLSEEEVAEIRNYSGTLSQRQLGACYGVTGQTVNQILKGVIWK